MFWASWTKVYIEEEATGNDQGQVQNMCRSNLPKTAGRIGKIIWPVDWWTNQAHSSSRCFNALRRWRVRTLQACDLAIHDKGEEQGRIGIRIDNIIEYNWQQECGCWFWLGRKVTWNDSIALVSITPSDWPKSYLHPFIALIHTNDTRLIPYGQNRWFSELGCDEMPTSLILFAPFRHKPSTPAYEMLAVCGYVSCLSSDYYSFFLVQSSLSVDLDLKRSMSNLNHLESLWFFLFVSLNRNETIWKNATFPTALIAIENPRRNELQERRAALSSAAEEGYLEMTNDLDTAYAVGYFVENWWMKNGQTTRTTSCRVSAYLFFDFFVFFVAVAPVSDRSQLITEWMDVGAEPRQLLDLLTERAARQCVFSGRFWAILSPFDELNPSMVEYTLNTYQIDPAFDDFTNSPLRIVVGPTSRY